MVMKSLVKEQKALGIPTLTLACSGNNKTPPNAAYGRAQSTCSYTQMIIAYNITSQN